MRVVRRQRKTTQTRRQKRSETRQGYIFEATVSAPARRINWQPVAALWEKHGGIILSVMLLAIVAWCGFSFFGTDDFYIYGVAVQGNMAVPVKEIFQASELDGQSVFWVNPERVAEAVARLPNIKSAEVVCRLPAQVTVQVVERQAQIVWQWREQQFWVDTHGVVLQPRGTLSDALLIKDNSPAPPHPGGRVNAEAVIGAQQLHELWPELRTVIFDPDLGLIFKSKEEWPVYLGVGDDMALKLAIWEALAADLREQGIWPAHIDLRYPQQPVYR